MPKTRINCPNCRQPIMADIDQLFDVNQDPTAKQRILSGAFNIAQCPNCGYQGMIATPIIYHDANKELLLTYFPPELNMPVNEQERMIGPLINQIVNRLPQAQRKAYLLRPQATLTLQSMAERILEADGITREMIQAQQQRLNLLQRLINTPPEMLDEVAKQEDALIDSDFFNILNQLIEAAMAQGDENSARRLADMQKHLLPITTAGRELEQQSKEVEAAIKSLQDAGRNLTREKLLDLAIEAPTETRLQVLTSLARPGMDYQFFQTLSERIDKASGEEKDKLTQLRDRLLQLTSEVDRQVEARTQQSRQLLNAILKEEDITEAAQEALPSIDEFFVQVLNAELAAARSSGNLQKLEKLQKIVDVLQQASAPPPEVALIEELLDAPDEKTRQAWFEEHREEVTPEFLDTIMALLAQAQSGEDNELLTRLQEVYRSALRFSMQANLKK
ncbi:MAG: hypothetical protein EHM70_04455 [Chloroflexota bacterium]|nr:MAG: hypothetical protein EHM70_04455 [Chloroflexota bacterium]